MCLKISFIKSTGVIRYRRVAMLCGGRYKPHVASHLAQSVGPGASLVGLGDEDQGARLYLAMLTIDDSDFTPDHMDFLHEWADNLGISVEVLLARIVLASSEGDQYVENVPDLRPTPRE